MLHYRQAGEGPPLVLIHGLFGSLENLGALARTLAERFQVFSVDLPNHGRSPHFADCDLTAMADCLRQWLDQVGLERAHVIGHSLGGKVAMELALASPQYVDRLGVMDVAPVSYKPRHQKVLAGLTAIAPEQLQDRSQADAQLAEYVPEPAVRSFLLKNLIKEEGQFRWRMNLADLRENYTELTKGNRSGRFSGATLFLKGANSDYIEESHRDELLTRFPLAQLKVVANAGHWLHVEESSLVAKLTAKFLEP